MRSSVLSQQRLRVIPALQGGDKILSILHNSESGEELTLEQQIKALVVKARGDRPFPLAALSPGDFYHLLFLFESWLGKAPSPEPWGRCDKCENEPPLRLGRYCILNGCGGNIIHL